MTRTRTLTDAECTAVAERALTTGLRIWLTCCTAGTVRARLWHMDGRVVATGQYQDDALADALTRLFRPALMQLYAAAPPTDWVGRPPADGAAAIFADGSIGSNGLNGTLAILRCLGFRSVERYDAGDNALIIVRPGVYIMPADLQQLADIASTMPAGVARVTLLSIVTG